MNKELECLKRIDTKNYLTERELTNKLLDYFISEVGAEKDKSE